MARSIITRYKCRKLSANCTLHQLSREPSLARTLLPLFDATANLSMDREIMITVRICGRIRALRVSCVAEAGDLYLPHNVNLCGRESMPCRERLGTSLLTGGTIEFSTVLRGGAPDPPPLAPVISAPAVESTQSGRMAMRASFERCTEEVRRIQAIAASGCKVLTRARGSQNLTIKPLTAEDDDREVAQKLFDELVHDSGSTSPDALPMETLCAAATKRAPEAERALLEALVTALRARTKFHDGGEVSFTDFFDAFKVLSRPRGDRLRWARTLGVEEALARLLLPGDAFDGLRGLRTLGLAEAEAHVREVCSQLSAALPGLLRAGLERLRNPERAQSAALRFLEDHFSTKFADNIAVGRFATLNDFYRGPEALIGMPNPRIRDGIHNEHCLRDNSRVKFTTSNYKVETWPALEWQIVVEPMAGTVYHKQDTRKVVGLAELLQRPKVRVEVDRARLREEEVICLRLYTGPMFVLYNAALRGLPEQDVACLKDNKYETTIFVITSGITKLSKMAAIPPSRLLYRGISGSLVLPEQFWRRYPECRVVLMVAAGGAAALDVIKRALRAEALVDAGSLARVAAGALEWGLLRLPGDEASIRGLEARLVSPPEAVGNNVRLTFALPVSLRQLSDVVQRQLVEAVGKLCAVAVSGSAAPPGVKISDVAEKPEDFLGGVELGLLSLTASREVALQYHHMDKHSSRQPGTVFEVQVGRVDIGASIEFLSQFPGESEYLMPPLSCLEMTGDPRVEQIAGHGNVVVIPLRINVNLKASTVEDLVGRRKGLHAAATKNLREELERGAAERAAALGRLLALRRKGAAALLRGLAQHVELPEPAEAAAVVRFVGSRWVTVGAPYLAQSSGKVYFEVEVIEAGPAATLAVGFAGTLFRDNVKGDIGDDRQSWGVYSFGKVRHDGQAKDVHGFGDGWLLPGAVLGVAVDIGAGRMLATCFRPAAATAPAPADPASAVASAQPSAGEPAEIVLAAEAEAAAAAAVEGGGAQDDCDDDDACRVESSLRSEWRVIFASGVTPGRFVGGGLFPVIAGGWNICAKYNFGHGPMRHCPPSKDYLTVADAAAKAEEETAIARVADGVSAESSAAATGDGGAAHGRVSAGAAAADAVLAKLGVGLQDLLLHFDEVRARHEATREEDFNDDGVYRDNLNEILDAKVCAERKQAAGLELLEAGAAPERLSALRAAPARDFRCAGALEAELPEYSWRLVLSGWFRFLDVVDIPLACPPCLIALVWRAALDSARSGGATLAVRVGGEGGRQAALAELLPRLCPARSGLQSQRFEHAVLGLVLAATAGDMAGSARAIRSGAGTGVPEAECGSPADSALTCADFRGLEISKERMMDLALAVSAGCIRGPLRRVNCLQVSPSAEGQNVRRCVARTGHVARSGDGQGEAVEGQASARPLGTDLDGVDWAFVAAEAARGGWRAFDACDNALDAFGAAELAVGLGSLTALTSLDLSRNDIQAAGATAMSGALALLVALQRLELQQNHIGSAGATAIAAGLRPLRNLRALGLAENQLGPAGVTSLSAVLTELAALDRLDLACNASDEAAGRALAAALDRLPALAAAGLGGQDMGDAVWPIMAALAPRIASLTAAFGILTAAPLLPEAQPAPPAGPPQPASARPRSAPIHGAVGLSASVVDLRDRKALGPDGAQRLAAVLLMGQGAAGGRLASLGLAHNGILREGATGLAPALAGLRALGHLDLSHNEIGAAGAAALLPHLTGLAALRGLRLEGNGVGAAGWAGLAGAVDRLSALESLNGCGEYGAIRRGGVAAARISGTELAAVVHRHLARSSTVLTELDVSAGGLDACGGRDSDPGGDCGDGGGAGDTREDEGRAPGSQSVACAVISSFSALSGLVVLHLERNSLGEHGGQACRGVLSCLGALRALHISYAELGPLGTSAVAVGLRTVTGLRTLSAAGNGLGADGAAALCDALAALPALSDLDLSDNELGAEGASSLASCLRHTSRLQRLNASENRFGKAGGEALGENLHWLSQLTDLDLHSNELGSAGGTAVLNALAASAREICLLNFSSNHLGGDGGVAAGAVLGRFPKLRDLNLAANALGEAGAVAVVASLASHADFRKLELGDNQLGPAGGAAIGQGLARLSALDTLFIEGNALGPTGAAAVVDGLMGLPALTALDLRDNTLGERGGVAIAESLGRIVSLKTLDLDGNALGPGGGSAVARGVAALPLLQCLDLRDNALGPEGSCEVAEQLASRRELHLDLRWNDPERKCSAKETSSLLLSRLHTYSTFSPRLRKVESVVAADMPIRGWLRKLNHGHEKELENDEHWRDRLCFVARGKLYYESAKKKGERELVAALASIARVRTHPDGWPPGHYIFTVEVGAAGHGGRSGSMIFSASSSHERARWIAALSGHGPVTRHGLSMAALGGAAVAPLPEVLEEIPSYARGESGNSSDGSFSALQLATLRSSSLKPT